MSQVGGGPLVGSSHNHILDYCRSNGIAYADIQLLHAPQQAKEKVEQYLVAFCRDNYNNLQNEKKGVEVDSGKKCTLI